MLPSKNELARSRKNLARILHARLAWHVHAICPFSCKILAQSCTYLARNGARFCKNCCNNNYLHFLHTFCKILQELVQDCARIVQEKGHIAHVPSKSCMQILAQSCTILHDLASSFLLGKDSHNCRAGSEASNRVSMSILYIYAVMLGGVT